MFPGFQPQYRAGCGFPLTRPACLSVEIQGIRMVGEKEPGRGPEWALTGWSGWTNGGDTRGGAEPFPEADGGFRTDVYYSGRDITLEGVLEAPTHEAFVREAERFGTLLTEPRWDWLTVDEQHLGMRRMILVHRQGPPLLTQESDRVGVFTLRVSSSMWQRVSTETSSLSLPVGGTGTAVNAGDYPADLSIELVGPIKNPRVTFNNTTWWQYNGELTAGETRTVNVTRRIIRNPAAGVRLDSSGSGEWPRLAPGATTVKVTGGLAGTVNLSWRSSWR